jgi:hypothetical protein
VTADRRRPVPARYAPVRVPWRRVLAAVLASWALSVLDLVRRPARRAAHRAGPSTSADPWGARYPGTGLQRWLLSWAPVREVYVKACTCDGDPTECSHEIARYFAELDNATLRNELDRCRLELAGRSDARRRQVARRQDVLSRRRLAELAGATPGGAR